MSMVCPWVFFQSFSFPVIFSVFCGHPFFWQIWLNMWRLALLWTFSYNIRNCQMCLYELTKGSMFQPFEYCTWGNEVVGQTSKLAITVTFPWTLHRYTYACSFCSGTDGYCGILSVWQYPQLSFETSRWLHRSAGPHNRQA
jgi:hypothetical protein